MKPYSASFQYKHNDFIKLVQLYSVQMEPLKWKEVAFNLFDLVLVNACIFHQMRSKQKLWLCMENMAEELLSNVGVEIMSHKKVVHEDFWTEAILLT
jgi:hypothetical protein